MSATNNQVCVCGSQLNPPTGPFYNTTGNKERVFKLKLDMHNVPLLGIPVANSYFIDSDTGIAMFTPVDFEIAPHNLRWLVEEILPDPVLSHIHVYDKADRVDCDIIVRKNNRRVIADPTADPSYHKTSYLSISYAPTLKGWIGNVYKWNPKIEDVSHEWTGKDNSNVRTEVSPYFTLRLDRQFRVVSTIHKTAYVIYPVAVRFQTSLLPYKGIKHEN